jgi:biotin operon repressor
MFGRTKQLEEKIDNLERKIERLLWINQDILGVMVKERDKPKPEHKPKTVQPEKPKKISSGRRQHIEKLPVTAKEMQIMDYIRYQAKTLEQIRKKFKIPDTTAKTYIRNLRYKGVTVNTIRKGGRFVHYRLGKEQA